MTTQPTTDVTRMLNDASAGRREAAGDLLPLVYQQLRAIAMKRMAEERSGHTLQATALVHEAYLRLVGNADLAWSSRGHFYFAAAEAMRRILIEHARKRGRLKRGGGHQRTPLSVVDLAAEPDPERIVSLDEAIQRLEKEDARTADVVRLRFFAGLGVEETARVLDVSTRTVMREWSYARAWLYRALEEREPQAASGGGQRG